MYFYNSKLKAICILQTAQISKLTKIPIKVTALYEGSHTRLIQYKINSITKIDTLQKQEIHLGQLRIKIRYVWLKNSLYTNITFARSLWNIINTKTFIKNIRNNNPIGSSFIKNQADISKNIYEIYYCYCKEFETTLGFKRPIWGRKYMIYNFNNYTIVMQEFFSPDIII